MTNMLMVYDQKHHFTR